MAYTPPALFDRLIALLTEATLIYLTGQIEAFADTFPHGGAADAVMACRTGHAPEPSARRQHEHHGWLFSAIG
jgi:hypothetical protein